MAEFNTYKISRKWFDFSFDNPELVHPTHTAILFFAIEHCNRLGQKEKFGFPSQMAADAIGIKRVQTFVKYLDDLVEWGFIEMIQKSKNQWSSNIISINFAPTKNVGADVKALDKAMLNHRDKQVLKQSESTRESKCPIDKQLNNLTTDDNTNAANAASSLQVVKPLKKPKPEVVGYAECIAVYDNWLKGRTGVGVKMDGMQGKAMKEIIKYLDSQKLNKEQPVEEVWEFILNSWDRLSDYHKNKLKLSEINSDLINILNQIKNGKQKSTNQDAVNFAISLLRDV